MTIIVGRRNDPCAEYIGRGSPLGNPFVIGIHGDRDAVCDQYEKWFRAEIERGNPAILAELRRLYQIARAGDLILGCYCAPRRCHGETIAEFLNSMQTEAPEESK